MDSFIGWVGGKKALRNIILAEFPPVPTTKYVEVFGGAGWVFFAKEKHPKQLEVYNDFDSDLVNLYRCIKHHREALEQELDFLFQSHEIFYDYKSQMQCRGLTDLQRAARYFYLIKESFGSKKDSFATSKKRINLTINRFKEVQDRLQGVLVENRDFEKLIHLYDSEDTLFYLDPPYHGTERYYNVSFTDDDHYRLNALLKGVKGKFILSYNDDTFVRDLYSDFNIQTAVRNNTLGSHSNNAEKFAELIIKNY